ncbi:MAG TPA: MarR family transcriptional regulator [Euzebyales bacterium]|nr:MarR family transcriptional regulator [Euzebyales bacterium]
MDQHSNDAVPDLDPVRAEADIRQRVGDLELDFAAMAVVSNIYRAASAIRNHMEQTVLARHGLSWTAFATLFVLWIWGAQESRHLAVRAGITKGTLTGIVRTLQKRGLCTRTQRADDRRLVTIALTPSGEEAIRELFPEFNAQEAHVTSQLATAQKEQLAEALRSVINTLDGAGEHGAGERDPRHA